MTNCTLEMQCSLKKNIGSLQSHSPHDVHMGQFLVIPVELHLSRYTGLSLQADVAPEATIVGKVLVAGSMQFLPI